MPLSTPSSGQQILHYRLTEKLGEGGMGVVWKATDTSLDREVAIKVLPSAFAADGERLQRFEREARLLASLNHPNIATLYTVHVVEGVRYLSMELVPGEDLAERIARGPVPVAEALEIAKQIAMALEAAHEQGVVHRDLKPANIRITPADRVKVLDFGLAKAVAPEPPLASGLSQSPTFAVSGMTSGMIVGTAAYMSPEQARGQAVDRRADIWAFGVVLYEMLTGTRAFSGETVSDTLAAVLRAEPDRALLPKDTPAPIRTLIDRCLEKNAKRRLRDIGEALITIEDVQAGRIPAAAAPAAAGARRYPALSPWTAAALLAGLVAGAVLLALLRPSPPPVTRKFTLSLQEGSETPNKPVISPSGRFLAYLLGSKLYVRDLSQTRSRLVSEQAVVAFPPLWAPDESFLVYATPRTIMRAALASGAISTICSTGDVTGGSGGSWAPDGSLIFAIGQDHLYRVRAGGGTPEPYIARIDSLEGDLHEPFVLPGGQGVLCVVHSLRTGPTQLALIRGGKRIEIASIPSGLMWSPLWDPRGYVLYERTGEGAGIWAVPFSASRGKATGEPFLIAPECGAPSISRNGMLAYLPNTVALESRALLIDRQGTVVDTLTPPIRGCYSVTLSPDGRKLLVETRESGGDADIWLYDLARHAQTRFAFGQGRQVWPVWTPDGSRMLYEDNRRIYEKAIDGSSAPRLVGTGFHPRVTPDGRTLVYVTSSPGGDRQDIWYRSLETGQDSAAFTRSAGAEAGPAPAPQGGFLAYRSDESGAQEIYLRPFPTGEGRWQVSASGGSRVWWSHKGDALYYMESDQIFEVPTRLQPSVELGTPRPLFSTAAVHMQPWGFGTFQPTPDPDRFMILQNRNPGSQSHTDVVVVENWLEEFRKRK